MNKINIIVAESDNLDGYHNLTIDDLNKVINGTCSEIICTALDNYVYKDRITNIVNLCKKLSNSLLIKSFTKVRMVTPSGAMC